LNLARGSHNMKLTESYQNQQKLGQVVSVRRRELGLSQAELAARLAYKNTNFVSMIESGQSELPLDRTSQFAEVLEIDARWLAERVLRARHPALADALFGRAPDHA
jgi:ribosome-binding protein aMBF1 (putative translation factor)